LFLFAEYIVLRKGPHRDLHVNKTTKLEGTKYTETLRKV